MELPAVPFILATRHITLVLVAAVLAACTEARHTGWTEEALQPDGSVVEVQRTVFANFGGELSQAAQRWPDRYEVQVKHPDSKKKLYWSGARGWNPIMLGFSDGRAHLVISGGSVSADHKQFGCPEIPYVFLRYDDEWRVMRPADFPRTLLRVNLSASFDGFWTKEGSHHTAADVVRNNKRAERDRSWFFSEIPTSFAEWPSRYKNEYRVRARRGCEHLVPSNEDPSHPQSPGKPAQEVALEVVQTQPYDPIWVIKGDRAGSSRDEWSKLSYGPEQMAKCRALVTRVDDSSDRPEMRGWLLFNKDPTGNRKARGHEPAFCDDSFLWFQDYDPSDRTRVYLSKFTHEGVLTYRLKFLRPDEPHQFAGHFMRPTLRAEAGYIYGEWWNTNQSGYDRQIARAMKVRLREPDSLVGAKP